MNKIESAIAIIKNNGTCQQILCEECPLTRTFCNKNFYKIAADTADILSTRRRQTKVNLILDYLIQLYGKEETKRILIEELI